ncbi:MAG: hypothetical protein AB7P07_03130 [Hyphomonadaceae bacterium]
MQGLIVRIALVADAAEEAKARVIAERFIGKAGRPWAFRSCTPYEKSGPHSRLTYVLALPEELDGQAVIDAVETIAAVAVRPEGLEKGYLNGFLTEDGSLFYNRIFDARVDPVKIRGLLWLDIEVETHPDAQASLRESLDG